MNKIDTSRLGPIRISHEEEFVCFGKQVKHLGSHFADAVDETAALYITAELNRAARRRALNEARDRPLCICSAPV